MANCPKCGSKVSSSEQYKENSCCDLTVKGFHHARLTEQEQLDNRRKAVNRMNTLFNEYLPKLIKHFQENKPRFKKDHSLYQADKDAAPIETIMTDLNYIRLETTGYGSIRLAIKVNYVTSGFADGCHTVDHVDDWHLVYEEDCRVVTPDPLPIHSAEAIDQAKLVIRLKKDRIEKAERELADYRNSFYPIFEQ